MIPALRNGLALLALAVALPLAWYGLMWLIPARRGGASGANRLRSRLAVGVACVATGLLWVAERLAGEPREPSRGWLKRLEAERRVRP